MLDTLVQAAEEEDCRVGTVSSWMRGSSKTTSYVFADTSVACSERYLDDIHGSLLLEHLFLLRGGVLDLIGLFSSNLAPTVLDLYYKPAG